MPDSPAWLKRLEALKAKHAPGFIEEARRKARPRREMDEQCQGCEHLANILHKASYRAGQLRSPGICQARKCGRGANVKEE